MRKSSGCSMVGEGGQDRVNVRGRLAGRLAGSELSCSCGSCARPLTGRRLQCVEQSEARYANCSGLSLEKTVAAMKLEYCPPFKNYSEACEAKASTLCGPAEKRWANVTTCEKCAEANGAELFAAGCPTDAEPAYMCVVVFAAEVLCSPPCSIVPLLACCTSTRC